MQNKEFSPQEAQEELFRPVSVRQFVEKVLTYIEPDGTVLIYEEDSSRYHPCLKAKRPLKKMDEREWHKKTYRVARQLQEQFLHHQFRFDEMDLRIAALWLGGYHQQDECFLPAVISLFDRGWMFPPRPPKPLETPEQTWQT